MFFAFAGYARIATLGEEVRDPARTIPRAILTALLMVLAIYAAIAVVLLRGLGPAGLATSHLPLVDLVREAGWAWVETLIRFAAGLASTGALLALIAGIGRTSMAMARTGDLPAVLAVLHPRFWVPHRAEITVGVVVVILVAVLDLRAAIGFSSFGVLIYYFVANLSAVTQGRSQRRYPRVLPLLGAVLCLVLVLTLPWSAVVVGTGVIGLGVVIRAIRLRLGMTGRSPTP